VLKNRKLVIDKREEFILDVDWCIGGKKTYEKYCKFFTELHISHINDNSIGDVGFPLLNELNKDCEIFNYYF
jgi:dihydrofolate reductase